MLCCWQKASAAVSVQAPANNVSFFCPTTVATTFEFRCNATVLSGTYMEMSVDYDDGVVETFPIAGQSVHINYVIISLINITRNSPGDETANVNFLRHRTRTTKYNILAHKFYHRTSLFVAKHRPITVLVS